jgi:very-short-patch-repair endonuclease
MCDEDREAHQRNLPRAKQMRATPTVAESTMWYYLRGHRLSGYKFRQQQTLGNYIVDFYCHNCQLVVEIDGDSHAEQVEYDADRTAWLEQCGYKVLRFTNDEVRYQIKEVLAALLKECQARDGIAPRYQYK